VGAEIASRALEKSTAIARDLPGQTISCRRIDDLVVVVHNVNAAPSDEEWDRYVKWSTELVKAYRPLKVLVVAGNHAPTSRQRSVYSKEIASDSVRIALLMQSPALLVVVKVFSWLIANIRAFDKNDIEPALAYLGVTPTREVRETIRQLGASAGKTKGA
jgi:hypothetical protein